MSYEKPYAGLRVVDASQGFAGPYCAGLMALYGADVIKIEPPTGDWARDIGRNVAGQTPLHIVGNRGKRSIALDMKKPGAADIVLKLAVGCDVFIESFRPGVSERLGFGYDAVRAVSPGVIYVSVTGFGQTGAYAGRPATDTILQAFSGLMATNKGLDGIPHRVGMLAVDTSAALHAFQALQAALFARRDGPGKRIEISLMQTTASFLTQKIAEHQMEGGAPRGLHAPAGTYMTKDGWIALTMVKNEQFFRLCKAVDRPDWAEDPRFATFDSRAGHKAELVGAMTEIMKQKTADEWIGLLHANDILSNKINDFGDWLADPHVRASGVLTSVGQPESGPVEVPVVPGTTPDDTLVAPMVGQHGREVLSGLGFDEGAIAALAGSGAVILPAAGDAREAAADD